MKLYIHLGPCLDLLDRCPYGSYQLDMQQHTGHIFAAISKMFIVDVLVYLVGLETHCRKIFLSQSRLGIVLCQRREILP